MKSMTGFGRAFFEGETFDLALDISSVNKRGLETSVSLPRDWQPMERLINIKIKKFFTRGKVHVACRVNFKADAGVNTLDEDSIAIALENLKRVSARLNIPFTPDLDTIIKLNESFSQAESADWEIFWPDLDKALDDAFEKIEFMRAEEGNALCDDLAYRIKLLEKYLADIEASSKDTVERYRAALLQRLAASGLELDLNDERILKEISLFADKCDIAEEITRLKSHFAQVYATLADNEPAGRKLDFLCQEMGREINTISSKTNNIELTKHTIEFKNELERVREQAQNLE